MNTLNKYIWSLSPLFRKLLIVLTKVLIDPLNIELIADALNARKGIRFHFPKDDSKGIKITFSDKELSLSEALLMTKLDY